MKKSFCISIGPVYLLLGLLIHLHAYAAPGKGADQRTIEAFTKLLKVEVPYGFVIENNETEGYLPSHIEAILNDGTKQSVPVVWNRGTFEGDQRPASFYRSHKPGVYEIYGTPLIDDTSHPDLTNPQNLKAVLQVNVGPYNGARPENRKLPPPADVSTSPWDKGAGNPLVPGYFADTHLLIHNGVYYFYSSTDQYVKFFADNGPFGVWKSKDFVNWEFKTFTYPDQFPSNDNWLWAPMAIQGPDGKFYLYYQRDITGTHVAVSDSPEGPWKAVRGAGLNDNADAIHTKAAWNYKGMHDADVFRDDDGKYYLTFNGPGQKGISSVIYVGELITDPADADYMCGFVKEPTIVMTKDGDGEHASEAASLYKKDGIYYLTYSEMGGEYYNTVYRMSTNIYGPYGEDFHIAQPAPSRQLRGPGHGMIFTNTDGNVYLLHHRQGYSQNITPYNPVNESGRQVGIEQLTFNANGTIQEVIPSYDGVKNKYMSPKLDWEENLSAAYDVTATASENSELATLAFDQNNVTQWVANSLAGEEQWLCADLGAVKEINRTEVFVEFPTRYYEYRIEYSKDGKRWETYADHRNSRDRNSPKKDEKRVKARYMKLFIGNIEGDHRIHDGKPVEDKVRACIFEFNIYGPGENYYVSKFKKGKDRVSLKFKGTQIRLYGDKKSAWGKETVYIDGVKQNQPADFTARTGNISNALVYASPALSYGKHTIEVEGAACTFTLKNAEIINHGPAPQLVATVDGFFNDTATTEIYTGEHWKTVSDDPEAHKRTLHSSTRQSDYAEFTFVGNQVELYGRIGTGDKAYISIDGSPYEYFKVRFDNNEVIDQYKVYQSPMLPYGRHTIKITTRGDQNKMHLDFAKVYKKR